MSNVFHENANKEITEVAQLCFGNLESETKIINETKEAVLYR